MAESVLFVRSGREADEIEIEAATESLGARLRRRREAFFDETRENEVIDGISRPGTP